MSDLVPTSSSIFLLVTSLLACAEIVPPVVQIYQQHLTLCPNQITGKSSAVLHVHLSPTPRLHPDFQRWTLKSWMEPKG